MTVKTQIAPSFFLAMTPFLMINNLFGHPHFGKHHQFLNHLHTLNLFNTLKTKRLTFFNK